ncbi:MAG: prolyl oligopeptidase family serine peptidase [Gemmatimonadota bacterium]
MKSLIALASLLVFACAGSAADQGTALTGQTPGADSCSIARPDFGGVATAADRALFSYNADAPLGLQKTVESTSNGVETSAISYSSPGGGQVTGLLFDPVTRSSLRPGMVILHGAPGNARQMLAQGQLLASYGAVVIAIDAPFARRSGSFLRFTADDRTEQVQLIKDLQRAVDVLRSRVNVDRDRIAYIGISYGGAMGALFVGIERRIKAAALVVADGGLVSHFTGPEDAGVMSGLSCATRAGWFRAMTPVEPIRFLPHATPIALLLQSGRTDNLVPAPDAEEVRKAAPEPKRIIWYEAGHGLNQQAAFERHDWLHEQIGLDARR